MIWFIKKSARVEMERREVAALAESASWLRIVDWRIDPTGICLCLDVDIIQSEARFFPITVRYPNSYPHTAPSVLPRGKVEQRWSEHQYLTADGQPAELCLEFGPDNWTEDLSAADLLKSAYRLLVGENPQDTAPSMPVASRHETTVGQDLRWASFRFLVTPSLVQFVQDLQSGVVQAARLQLLSVRQNYTAVVKAAGPVTAPVWVDSIVPDNAGVNYDGLVVRLDGETDRIPETDSFAELSGSLVRSGVDLATWMGCEQPLSTFIVLATQDRFMVWWRYDRSKDTLVRFRTVMSSDDAAARLSPHCRNLSEKKVAVVGCGSAGSKIGMSLARSGVGHFVLVDDDILLPENLVRSDLDWRAVGGHKAEALWERIQLVNPTATADVRRIRLSAQESSTSAAAALSAISGCDLVIDATASSAVFNLLSAVVESASKPMIWLEIFGGGYGGLVARYRPGVDPKPQAMRAGILQYCAQHGEEWPRSAADYGAVDADRVPWVADDADVGVIAMNAARLALDQLCERVPSQFPHAIYLVGLSEGWIFKEPFDTRPFDLEPERAPRDDDPNLAETNAGLEFVNSLTCKLRDESVDPS